MASSLKSTHAFSHLHVESSIVKWWFQVMKFHDLLWNVFDCNFHVLMSAHGIVETLQKCLMSAHNHGLQGGDDAV